MAVGWQQTAVGSFVMGSTDTQRETSNQAPILICYDGSDSARRAINVAADLLGPRAAVVLNVGPWLTASESIAAISAIPGNAFEELNQAAAAEYAREGALLACEAGLDATACAELAAPTWEGIVDIADELESPLIVVGTRALSPARELVDGSVSHEVVLHAGRPVLVVPLRHDRAERGFVSSTRRRIPG